MTAYSTQGYTARLDNETALGTAGGSIDKDIRLAAAPTVPTATRQLQEQPNIGHENAGDVSDKPIPYEAAAESALTLPIHVRRGAATLTPPLYYFCTSGGWEGDISIDDDVDDVAPSATDFDTSNNIFGDTSDHYGKAILVQLADDTTYHPMLLAKYTHATTNAKAMMNCPTIPGDNNLIKRMYNLYADPGPVAATDTLQFVCSTRGKHTTAPDMAYTYAGCALADLGEIAINREGAVVLNPVFHVADTSVCADTLNAAAFLEGDTTDASTSHYQRNESSNFRFEIAAFAAGGGITAATQQLISATVRPNVTTIPIEGVGSTSCLNGIQGYMGRLAPPECDVQILMDIDYINDASKGIEAITGNQFTYLGFVWQTTSLSTPASGIWLPKCYQYAPPDVDMFNEKYQLVTLHFRATSPAYTGSPTTNGSSGMSPIVIAVHGQAT